MVLRYSDYILKEMKMNSEIITPISIKGEISDNKISINGVLTSNNNILVGSVNTSTSAPPYTGSYDIIPSIEEQTLNNKNKLLSDDLSIKEIPYFETSNPYGETIYIG